MNWGWRKQLMHVRWDGRYLSIDGTALLCDDTLFVVYESLDTPVLFRAGIFWFQLGQRLFQGPQHQFGPVRERVSLSHWTADIVDAFEIYEEIAQPGWWLLDHCAQNFLRTRDGVEPVLSAAEQLADALVPRKLRSFP